MYISNDERKPEGSLEVQVRCVKAFPEKQGLSRFDNQQLKDLLEVTSGRAEGVALIIPSECDNRSSVTGLYRRAKGISSDWSRLEMREGDRAL